ncbi:hypothetical protein SAY87_029993 [Trapa incisa]|uniref:Uncharacterized protein n=1 Tax=Trapa incisa TaxID=236973 RepID=A0AAN7QA59_9MYRT|nr:hypothetical protein SAY87_029993 [Trapa incisa]
MDQEVHHRHLSPLYGLFHGHTTTVEDTAELLLQLKKPLLELFPGKFMQCLLPRVQNAYRMNGKACIQTGGYGSGAALAKMLVQSTYKDLPPPAACTFQGQMPPSYRAEGLGRHKPSTFSGKKATPAWTMCGIPLRTCTTVDHQCL